MQVRETTVVVEYDKPAENSKLPPRVSEYAHQVAGTPYEEVENGDLIQV